MPESPLALRLTPALSYALATPVGWPRPAVPMAVERAIMTVPIVRPIMAVPISIRRTAHVLALPAIGRLYTSPAGAAVCVTVRPVIAVPISVMRATVAISIFTAAERVGTGPPGVGGHRGPTAASANERASASTRPAPSSSVYGRRTPCRASCGDCGGSQSNRDFENHDAHSVVSEHPSLSSQTRLFRLSCGVRQSRSVTLALHVSPERDGSRDVSCCRR